MYKRFKSRAWLIATLPAAVSTHLTKMISRRRSGSAWGRILARKPSCPLPKRSHISMLEPVLSAVRFPVAERLSADVCLGYSIGICDRGQIAAKSFGIFPLLFNNCHSVYGR